MITGGPAAAVRPRARPRSHVCAPEGGGTLIYGINTFLWASPFKTRHLPLLDKGKALGFDLVEIPVEGEQDIDYAKAAEAF